MAEGDDRAPHEYPRRILLATVGLAPQVVTETLYALVRQKPAPFVPTEILIVTTTEGRELTRLTLLDRSRAMLARFADEFDVPDVARALTLERIFVITDANGTPLADIATEKANEVAADLISNLVRELTSDPNAALHVSIAGGRKTMGFLLGTTMSLFGRTQDRLSHVLVEPAQLEQHPKFFYPPRIPVVLDDPRNPNRPIDTKSARVTLADIPFVRLRHGMPTPLLRGAWTYSETVNRAQELVRPPELTIDISAGFVSCGGVIVRLSPALLAFYAWIAKRRQMLGDDSGVHAMEAAPSDLLEAHLGIPGLRPNVLEDLRRQTANGHIPETFIEMRKTRVNAALTAALGQRDTVYHVSSLSLIPGTQYERQGLAVPPTAITFGPLVFSDERD